ncbi:MMS19 nucleotide excision repair protein [Entamoeba marina]
MSSIQSHLTDLIEGPSKMSDSYHYLDDLRNSGDYSVSKLVQDLGQLLPSENDRSRLRATSILTHALLTYPIPTENRSVYIEYMCSRLIDLPCLEPVLTSLLFLLSEPFEANVLEDASLAISTIHSQLLPADTRVLLFQFFIKLLESTNVPNAIDTAVGLVELERDPSCLEYSFQIIQKVSKHPEMDAMAAPLLFDCASAYFPILYPPRNDMELKEKLTSHILNCFISSDCYANLAIPFLLDKLEADLENIKLEALKALLFCCQHYQLNSVKGYFEHIWDALERDVAAVGVQEIIEVTSQLVLFLVNNSDNNDVLLVNLKSFCLRMMSEDDVSITAFIDSILEAVICKNEHLFGMFVQDFIAFFMAQFEDFKFAPITQIKRELNVLIILYGAVLDGMPLLDCMKNKIVTSLYKLLTTDCTYYSSLLHVLILFSLLNLLPTSFNPYQETINFSQKNLSDSIPLLQVLLLRSDETTLSYLSIDSILQSTEMISGLGLYSSKLFESLLNHIPFLPNEDVIPVLQVLLADAIPDNCLASYAKNAVNLFKAITTKPLSTLFTSIAKRVSRLHSVLNIDLKKIITNELLETLPSSPRIILLLPTLLPYYTPDNLLTPLLNIGEIDNDTVAIYSLLVASLTDDCPQQLKSYSMYFLGYKVIDELNGNKELKLTNQFIKEIVEMNTEAINCLKEMCVLSSLNGEVGIWKEKFFTLVYDQFTTSHSIESTKEAHIVMLLYSLLPVDKLVTFETTVLKVFSTLCVPTGKVNEIDTAMVLLYNILPDVASQSMSIIEDSLELIITKLFNVLYIENTTIKYRCDVLDLLARIRFVYGPESVRNYQRFVLKKILKPLDDPKKTCETFCCSMS